MKEGKRKERKNSEISLKKPNKNKPLLVTKYKKKFKKILI